MRVLGLDVGERRIGVALSDPGGVLASALKVIERKGDDSDLQEIAALAEQEQVERIVVGLPRSLDGSLGAQAKVVLAFCDRLARYTEMALLTWDERLSTIAAERVLREAGIKKRKQESRRDAVAAAVILQGYLDRVREGNSEQPGG